MAGALPGARVAKRFCQLGSEGFSLTAEQLEASRSERMRQNGRGQITFEDARTWLEETGLCLFLPRKQFSSFVAPSFVEAVAGERSATPSGKIVSLAEELLVRLETEGVAVRLNLLGQPGDLPDFVVAAWVLPYVYALRGDRDWRRIPQLTGSRQVSPLAVQTFKHLEQGDATIYQLKHALGREVTESAVLRAITELWQQLRIIPVIATPGKPAQWQLLRLRFQKAIAEGASTSQVTAISVLASIYLQAVIAATMEEVELFLAPLTARSKVREVLRGLLATRQVHTISLGSAPHFYVAGTLPEFAAAPTIYASATMPASSYFLRSYEHHEDRAPSPAVFSSTPIAASKPPSPQEARIPDAPAPVSRPIEASAQLPRFVRPIGREQSGNPGSISDGNHSARREMRGPAPRNGSPARWSQGAAKNGHAKQNGARPAKAPGNGNHFHSNGNGHSSRPATRPTNGHSARPAARPATRPTARPANGSQNLRKAKPAASRNLRNGRLVSAKSAVKSGSRSAARPGSSRPGSSRPVSRRPASSRKDVRSDKRVVRTNRKPALTASAKAGARGRYGFTAPSRQGSKKRG
jgi:23S rRNA pseudouridine2605 synthase